MKAARLLPHRKADAALIVRHAERLRQARGLISENEPAAVLEFRLAVVLRSLGRGEPAVRGGLGVLFKEVGEVFVGADLDQMPVVQPRARDGAVGNVDPVGLDVMQMRPRRRSGARDIAAVLRDLRLHEHDIEHDGVSSTRKFNYCTAKILRIQPKIQSFETKF